MGAPTASAIERNGRSCAKDVARYIDHIRNIDMTIEEKRLFFRR